MLLGVQVDDKLLVDSLRDLCADGHVEELAGKGLCVELKPGVLCYRCNRLLDNLEALAPFADCDYVAGLYLSRRDVAVISVEGDMIVGNELTCGCPGRGDAETVHYVVETALEEEDEVLTLLTGEAGSLDVGVVELALQNSVHIFDFLLLLELSSVLFALFALRCETVLSRREVSLLKIFVSAEDGLAEFTGDFGAGTGISCHNS